MNTAWVWFVRRLAKADIPFHIDWFSEISFVTLHLLLPDGRQINLYLYCFWEFFVQIRSLSADQEKWVGCGFVEDDGRVSGDNWSV